VDEDLGWAVGGEVGRGEVAAVGEKCLRDGRVVPGEQEEEDVVVGVEVARHGCARRAGARIQPGKLL